MRLSRLPLLSLLVAAGCEKGTPPFGDPTVADRAEVLSYARSLEYDTTDAASGTTRVDGVAVRWSPERRAAGVSDANLVRGRIIGMAQTTGGTSVFGTLEGRSYIWVDSTAAGWRAIAISDNPAAGLATIPLQFGTRPFRAEEAPRFRTHADSFPNGRCGNRCCILLASTWTPTPELLQRITDGTHVP